MPKAGGRAGKPAKPKKKTPKKQIEELTEANTLLTAELEALRTEATGLREKVTKMGKKMLITATEKQLEKLRMNTQTDPLQLSIDTIMDLVDQIVVVRKEYNVSVAARVEDLEQQLTEIGIEVARTKMKMLAYEAGLSNILKCSQIEEAKDKVYDLQFIAAQENRTCEVNDPSRVGKWWLEGVGSDIDIVKQESLEISRKLNLIPPDTLSPGNTHILSMYSDLRMYIMKELSNEKASGADWRCLAQRVGISNDLIEYWQTERVQFAGARVFLEWGKSPAATVRILHRHLMSPIMRCTILGKTLASFYDVD